MKEILREISEMLKVMNGLKWGVLFLAFFAFFSWQYKDYIGEWLLGKNRMPPVEQTINRDILIYDVLEEMLMDFDGGRAYVYTFHNGQNFLSNDQMVNHKQRSSMDYEVVASGVAEIALQMQNLPTSLFSKQMQLILEERILGMSVEDTEDQAARSLMRKIGSSHAAVLPFKDNDGNTILLIGLDWMMKDEISFSEIRFRKYVEKVGNLFMSYEDNSGLISLNGITRGATTIEDHSFEPQMKPFVDEENSGHFIAGIKKLPRSNISLR